MNPEQTKVLQTIWNDFLAWEREGDTRKRDRYFGLMKLCAGVFLFVGGRILNYQDEFFPYPVEVASYLMSVVLVLVLVLVLLGVGDIRAPEQRSVDIFELLMNYQPVDKEAYRHLMTSDVYVDSKVRKKDLKNWLNAELAAIEKAEKGDNVTD